MHSSPLFPYPDRINYLCLVFRPVIKPEYFSSLSFRMTSFRALAHSLSEKHMKNGRGTRKGSFPVFRSTPVINDNQKHVAVIFLMGVTSLIAIAPTLIVLPILFVILNL